MVNDRDLLVFPSRADDRRGGLPFAAERRILCFRMSGRVAADIEVADQVELDAYKTLRDRTVSRSTLDSFASTCCPHVIPYLGVGNGGQYRCPSW
jgi:hypothetical protein